jgi:hypothetical protein
MAQYTIDCPCIADTYIDSKYPNTNYGSSTTIKCYTELYDNAFIFAKYDLSLLPPRKKIVQIKFRFYNVYSLTPADADGWSAINHRTTLGDWDESNTWNSTDYEMKSGRWSSVYITQSISANQYYEIELLKSLNIEDLRTYGLTFGHTKTGGGQYVSEPFAFHSREGANPSLLKITYEDAPPNPPTLLEPIGSYEDAGSVIRFEWQYNSDVGGEQKAFDLEYSADQDSWTTIYQTTSNTYYDMPAETFAGGNIYWRVKTYNEYDEASEYSEIKTFYAVGAPETPVINSISANKSRPIIEWTAFRQQIFQIQIMQAENIVYDTGSKPGINIRQHKVTAFLTDGQYTARIRIKNEYDLWSAWGEASFTIATTKPDKPSIALQTSAYGIELNFSEPPEDGYNLIYRSDYEKDDYICIGKTTATSYQDNTVRNNAEYKYFIRAVTAEETFEDSNVKFIQAHFKQSLIAPVSDLTNVFVFSRSLNAPPKRVYNRNTNSASVYYAGRRYPVDEPTENIAAGMSFTYFLKVWADVERFIEIYDLKGIVLYRDAKGRKIYGALSNLSVTDELFGYTISFVINQTDYNESVEV